MVVVIRRSEPRRGQAQYVARHAIWDLRRMPYPDEVPLAVGRALRAATKTLELITRFTRTYGAVKTQKVRICMWDAVSSKKSRLGQHACFLPCTRWAAGRSSVCCTKRNTSGRHEEIHGRKSLDKGRLEAKKLKPYIILYVYISRMYHKANVKRCLKQFSPPAKKTRETLFSLAAKTIARPESRVPSGACCAKSSVPTRKLRQRSS